MANFILLIDVIDIYILEHVSREPAVFQNNNKKTIVIDIIARMKQWLYDRNPMLFFGGKKENKKDGKNSRKTANLRLVYISIEAK